MKKISNKYVRMIMLFGVAILTAISLIRANNISFAQSVTGNLFGIHGSGYFFAAAPHTDLTSFLSVIDFGGTVNLYTHDPINHRFYTLLNRKVTAIDMLTGNIISQSQADLDINRLHSLLYESTSSRLLGVYRGDNSQALFLIEIDPITGTTTQLSSEANNTGYTSFYFGTSAIDESGHRVFAVVGEHILTYDTQTGSLLNEVLHTSGHVLTSIEYHPASDSLVGISGYVGQLRFVRINHLDGTVTPISALSGYNYSEPGISGIDLASNRYFAFLSVYIVTIDITTGAVTYSYRPSFNASNILSFVFDNIEIVYPTITPTPTETDTPTITPSPIVTNTLESTSTPIPTDTALPTATSTPTPTPTSTPALLYNFTGFFQPVDNLPILNQVKAGRAVPVKFSLGGTQGLDIFALGYPKSEEIVCNSTALVDGIEETVAAGANGLSYNAATGIYTYVWKIDNSWTGTCRQLVIKLNDNTYHRANFTFK